MSNVARRFSYTETATATVVLRRGWRPRVAAALVAVMAASFLVVIPGPAASAAKPAPGGVQGGSSVKPRQAQGSAANRAHAASAGDTAAAGAKAASTPTAPPGARNVVGAEVK